MVNRTLSGTCEISTSVFTVTNRPPSYVGENGAMIVTVAFKNNGSDADLTGLNAEMYLYYPGVSRMTESVDMTISGSSATGRFLSQLTVESGWPLLVIQLVDSSTSELIVACAQPIQVIETRGGEVITTRPPTPSEIVYVGRSPYVDPTTKHWMEWDDGEYVDTGIAATGINDIQKTGTSGNVDTYTITLSDGSTHTFTVTNGSDIASITKTGTSGLTDTYTITLTDGSTTTFTVTNGRSITNIAKTGTSGNVDTYTITYNDGTTSTFTVTNGSVTSVNGQTGDVVIPNATTSVDGLMSSADKQTLNNTKDAVETRTKRVILIGDSYGIDNEYWTGWQTAFDNLGAYYVFKSAVGGSGLVGDPNVSNFYQQLQSLESSVTSPETITDIVMMGGYNDVAMAATESDLLVKMGQIVTYCRSNYPYAKIWYGYIPVSYRSDGTQTGLNTYRGVFKRICYKFQVDFIPNAWAVLWNKDLIYMNENDSNWGFHPNTKGGQALADFLALSLTAGYADVDYYESLLGGIDVSSHNGDVTVTFRSDYPFYQNVDSQKIFPAGNYAYNTWIDILDLKTNGFNLLWGGHTDVTFTSWIDLWDLTGSGQYQATIRFRIKDKKLQIKNMTNYPNITLANDGYLIGNSFVIPKELNFA